MLGFTCVQPNLRDSLKSFAMNCGPKERGHTLIRGCKIITSTSMFIIFRKNERKQTPIRQRQFTAEDAEKQRRVETPCQGVSTTANTREWVSLLAFISVHWRFDP